MKYGSEVLLFWPVGSVSSPKDNSHFPKGLHDLFLHLMNLMYILGMSIATPVSSPVLHWQPWWTQLLLLKEQRKAMLFCLVITRILNPLGPGILSWQSGFPIHSSELWWGFAASSPSVSGSEESQTFDLPWPSLSSEIPLNPTKDFWAQKVLLY